MYSVKLVRKNGNRYKKEYRQVYTTKQEEKETVAERKRQLIQKHTKQNGVNDAKSDAI